jgi:hypothetical protein
VAGHDKSTRGTDTERVATAAMQSFGEDEEEEEEVPNDIASLSPEKQEAAIKKKAFTMLGVGTFLVLLFSGKLPFPFLLKKIILQLFTPYSSNVLDL